MKNAVQKNSGRLNLGWALFGGLALLGTAGCMDMSAAGEEPADKHYHGYSNKVVLDWSVHAKTAIHNVTAGRDPHIGTRTLTMVHLAMHDAINSADREYERYSFEGSDRRAHPVAAAAAAAHGVLVGLFPAQAADLDAKLAASLADVSDGSGEDRGVALGQEVGAYFVQLRADDGSNDVVSYTPGTGPGKYQFVPPFDGFIFKPQWRFVTPFALTSQAQFRSDAPPALTSLTYTEDYNEVKAAGVLTGSNRTAEQTTYAKFWYENSDIGWNSIARDVVSREDLDLHRSARLFALMNMAIADGYIAGWESKFHYDLWRPFTAIRAGETDGNDATAADTAWAPLLATPPVQDYPSTHSVAGEAAATVLGRLLGDETTFSFTSSTAEDPNLPRTYTRFSQAAAENADSRVRAGLHFRFACEAGLEMGDDVGDYVYENLLERDY